MNFVKPLDRSIFKYTIDSRKCNDLLSQFILSCITEKATAIACKDSLSDFFKLPIDHRFVNEDEQLLGFFMMELMDAQKYGGKKK